MLLRLLLGYCVQVLSPYRQDIINFIEGVQKIATRIIPVLKGKSFEERLEALALTTLIERRYRGDMIQTHKMLTREEDIDPTKFFQMAIERSDPALARGFKMFKILANRKQRRYPFPWGFPEEIFLFHEGLQTPGTS